MNDRHHNPSDFDRLPDEPGGDAFERDEVLNEELLSAYLDGECTADEQADAEARITASPELRQLVDDLRNVRTSLEVLPQHRLEANFAERVLRRAEREVLTGDRGLTRAATAAADHQAPSPAASVTPIRRERFGSARFGSARPFLWTVAALAAAILILVTNREPAIHRDPIARGPEAKYAPADKSGDRGAAREQNVELSVAEIRKEDRAGTNTDPTDKERKLAKTATADEYATPPADDVANHPKAFLEQESAELQRSVREQPDSAKDLPPEYRKNVVRPRGAPAGARAFGVEPMPLNDSAKTMLDRDALDAKTSEIQTEATTSSVRLRRPSTQTAPEDLRLAPQQPAAPPLSEPAAAPRADTLEKGAADLDQSVQAPGEAPSPVTNGVDTTNADPAFMFTAPAESLRVVEVLVARDAWQSGAVIEVLSNHRIAVFDATSTEALTQSPSTAPSSGDKANERGQVEAKRAVNFAMRPAGAEEMELFVVSAPSAQIAAALDDFQQQEQFRVMKVTDASAPEQLYEQTVGALGLNQSSRGYGYGRNRPSQTGQLSVDRAGKKELNVTAGAQSADGKAQDSAADSVDKDAQTETVPADAKAVQIRPAEESETAAQPARSKKSTTTSAAAGPPGAASTEADEIRQSRAARGVPVPSYGTAGGGVGRFAAPVVTGGSGSKAGFAENEKAGRSGGGYGGYGGGGYGAGGFADGTTAPPATTANVPLGYGQRLTLQPVTNYGTVAAGGLAGRNGMPPARTETLAGEPSPAGSLGRERVLFFFRIVDAPLPGAVDRANAAATPAGPADVAEPRPAGREDAKATPVPAPSTPGPTAR
ncbi:MAG: hypothetical protein WD894_16900 [Pirellulales bacterium]